MRLKEYLLESQKIEKSDINTIHSYIKNPPKSKKGFTLDSYQGDYGQDDRTVKVYSKNSDVVFEYNLNLYALTLKIVEMLDVNKYEFESGYKSNSNIAWIKVKK